MASGHVGGTARAGRRGRRYEYYIEVNGEYSWRGTASSWQFAVYRALRSVPVRDTSTRFSVEVKIVAAGVQHETAVEFGGPFRVVIGGKQ